MSSYTESEYQAQIKRCEKIADWLHVQPAWPPINAWGWPEAILRNKVAAARLATTTEQRDAAYAALVAQKDLP